MEKFHHNHDCVLLIARTCTSSLQKLKKKLSRISMDFRGGRGCCRDNFRRVRIISDWPKTIGGRMIRHDVTMVSSKSKMAAH